MNNSTPSYQTILIVGCTTLLAATLYSPVYPQEQWLQHTPTALALPALWWGARRRAVTNASMTCLTAMLALHILGARWIYSYVPYEQWMETILGSGPQSWFSWTRNHYDRFVHLAFGLLMTLPLVEAAQRYGGASRLRAVCFAWLAVVGASAAYEVLEWLLAVIAAPDYAERYNGQQGDYWDAQKDMALAMAGSAVAATVMAVTDHRRHRRRKASNAINVRCTVAEQPRRPGGALSTARRLK